jgi:hypothetical protein
MDPLVRWLIQLRLGDGRLPRGRIAEVLASSGDGQPCDGCGALIAKDEKAVSGLVAEDWRGILLHVDCFQVWDVERLGDHEHREYH